MDSADRALLESSVRDALDGTRSSPDDALAELGWLDMLDAEPRDAVDIVFTALGTTNVAATVLDDVIVTALGVEPRPELGVVLPGFSAWGEPGRLVGEEVDATGLMTARVRTASELVLVSRRGSELMRVVAPTAAADVTPLRGVDPGAGLHAVGIEHSRVVAEPLEAAQWDAAIAAGRRALAHQVSGACRAMLALARAHATEREQFGRPVARFQAVRHRLAEALVAVEALDATLTAAWDEPGTMTAALTKAAAGRAARTVRAHCQQVLAGIGFTTDHPFHGFLKRTMVLDGLLGSADDIVVDVGHRLLAQRHVPTLVEL